MNRKTNTVTFRASPTLQRRIDELAHARGLNRSKAIQAALVEATMADDVDAIPTEHELLCLLGESARAGNVAAMRQLRAYHRGRERESDDFAEFDELARRRSGGG